MYCIIYCIKQCLSKLFYVLFLLEAPNVYVTLNLSFSSMVIVYEQLNEH